LVYVTFIMLVGNYAALNGEATMPDLIDATLAEIMDEIRARYKSTAPGYDHTMAGLERLIRCGKSPRFRNRKAEAAMVRETPAATGVNSDILIDLRPSR
jgi:ribosomal protein L17